MREVTTKQFVKSIYPTAICHKYYNPWSNITWFTIFSSKSKLSRILGQSQSTPIAAWTTAKQEINKEIMYKLES